MTTEEHTGTGSSFRAVQDIVQEVDDAENAGRADRDVGSGKDCDLSQDGEADPKPASAEGKSDADLVGALRDGVGP